MKSILLLAFFLSYSIFATTYLEEFLSDGSQVTVGEMGRVQCFVNRHDGKSVLVIQATSYNREFNETLQLVLNLNRKPEQTQTLILDAASTSDLSIWEGERVWRHRNYHPLSPPRCEIRFVRVDPVFQFHFTCTNLKLQPPFDRPGLRHYRTLGEPIQCTF